MEEGCRQMMIGNGSYWHINSFLIEMLFRTIVLLTRQYIEVYNFGKGKKANYPEIYPACHPVGDGGEKGVIRGSGCLYGE
jgi:hypothetical protein